MLSDNTTSHELHQPQKGLQIKQDDKFFSRLMSKETSMANSSSRVYYGGASGAVPFMWESQPGTPKHPSSDTAIPPLTPPPSYHSSFRSKSMQKKSMKPTFLSSILPRLMVSTSSRKKTHASPSSSSWSSASSSSSLSSWSYHSSSSSSANSKNIKFHRRSYFSCSRSPVHSFCMEDGNDDEGGLGSSPTSTLCFGVKRRNLNKFRAGQYSIVNMKKALLSILSHGSSGQGTTV
ncbi:hypothetical protein PTKIN_Ptkin16aG0008200 [Pterospermum kingtungense]